MLGDAGMGDVERHQGLAPAQAGVGTSDGPVRVERQQAASLWRQKRGAPHPHPAASLAQTPGERLETPPEGGPALKPLPHLELVAVVDLEDFQRQVQASGREVGIPHVGCGEPVAELVPAAPDGR